MKWGSIKDEFKGFAWKRLSDHEVNPEVSNGHEFQGVSSLRKVLGDTGLHEIPTDYYLIGDDEFSRPSVEEVISSTASWYDSRRDDPSRSAEWRLYYPAPAGNIQVKCLARDLMIIGLRRSERLAVFLVQAGGSSEAAFINLLQMNEQGSQSSRGTFYLDAHEDDVGVAAAELIEFLAVSMGQFEAWNAPPPFPVPEPVTSEEEGIRKISDAMIKRWPGRLGTCEQVCDLVVREIPFAQEDLKREPDAALLSWLEAAETAYRVWEESSLSNFIGNLRDDRTVSNVELANRISKEWMSLRQSRVSRAGKMMELFLCGIFDACGLRYNWGARIEGGKLPDFVFPSAQEYADESFSASNLRILGAKTSLKERWRQILSEGDRVLKKHGVTRDISVTPAMFKQMREASFYVVIPAGLKSQYIRAERNLITLSDFVDEVRSVQDNIL